MAYSPFYSHSSYLFFHSPGSVRVLPLMLWSWRAGWWGGPSMQVPYAGLRFSPCPLQYALQRWAALGLRRQGGDARGCRCTAALAYRLRTRVPQGGSQRLAAWATRAGGARYRYTNCAAFAFY
jgi:hypothetical protein